MEMPGARTVVPGDIGGHDPGEQDGQRFQQADVVILADEHRAGIVSPRPRRPTLEIIAEHLVGFDAGGVA